MMDISVTPEQASAMDELEGIGLTFCGNFGYENAINLRDEMRSAFADGILYEWLQSRMGHKCWIGPEGSSVQ